MINKQQIITAVFAVIVSVSLVALVVSAATTVGDNVDIAGTTISSGNLSVGGKATTTAASGNFATEGTGVFVGDLSVGGNATTTAASGNFATKGTVTIGSGTAIAKHLSTSTSVDLPSVAATSCATSAVSVGLSGVTAGDIVLAGPTATDSLIEAFPMVWSSYASSAANYVTLTVCNLSNGAIDLAAQTWRFDVWQH